MRGASWESAVMLLTPNWLEWYHFRHQQECFRSGSPYEDYVTEVLRRHHNDFINPAPAGTFGDGGCDGIADRGTVLYACYGQRPGRDAERETERKLIADFERGWQTWNTFTEWRFVTNAPIGPKTTRALISLQQEHSCDSSRPLDLRIWTTEDLWSNVVSRLPPEVLNEIFPGAPGVENLELADLVPLLESLGKSGEGDELGQSIPAVPPTKMDFNNLSTGSRAEFNAGRIMAPRIARWYEESADPALYDAHGDNFTKIYRAASAVTTNPAEILERIYVAVAGENFRMHAKRANAAYAVVAHFFDSCHIFEMPPDGRGDVNALAN